MILGLVVAACGRNPETAISAPARIVAATVEDTATVVDRERASREALG